MIIATDLYGNSEIINKFNNFEMNEELNGVFTLSFTSYQHVDNPGHSIIMQEGFVEYDGYTFRIKQLRRQTGAIHVVCISTYYNNVDVFRYDMYGGTHTLSEFMTYVLSDTGWNWVSENIDVGRSEIIPNFGQNNVIRLIDELKVIFGFELRIDRGSQVTISTALGQDNDAQYRYGHNIASIAESIDTTKLKTYIEGFGANGLHVTYTSPYSENPGIGLRHAEPIYDDSYEDSESLLNHIKTQLSDYPESIIELGDVVLMDKTIGDRVWVIHERMGIEYQTRVIAKRIKIPNSLSSVTLGTYLPQSRTIGNTLATQQLNIDRNNSITRSRFDQTNERIRLEVTRLDGVGLSLQSSITIEAGRITQEVTDRTNAGNTLQASIVVEANRITQEVSNRQTGDANTYNNSVSYIEQTATSIRSEVSTNVSRLDGRVDSSNSLISQTATSIRSEVSTNVARLDGRVDTSNSLISQTATSIRSEVSTSVNRLDGRVDSASSLISQQADEILLRVRKDGIVSSINQTPESIRISASKIDLYGTITINDLNPTVSSRVTRIDSNGLYTGTIRADNIIGGTISGVNINVDSDVTVGNNIYLGDSSYGNRNIRFYGPAGISYRANTDSILIGAMNGVYIDGRLTANSELYVGANRVLTVADSVVAKFG